MGRLEFHNSDIKEKTPQYHNLILGFLDDHSIHLELRVGQSQCSEDVKEK